MYFIIETENGIIEDVEQFVLVKVLESQSSTHQYSLIDKEDLTSFIKYTKSIDFKKAIPVGSINFVREYLKLVHNISDLTPIEVPIVLRKSNYLKREYLVLKREELPKKGVYFLKSASTLKGFGYLGEISNIVNSKNSFLNDELYVLSEKVEILSEYRCFVLNDIIKGIQHYNGDCTETLTKDDINLIKEMVKEYSKDDFRPKAYTLDVGIIKDKGVAILEVHTHSSVGLYGYDDESLPYHYKFGFEWYLNSKNFNQLKFSDIEDKNFTKEGYLKFKNGYIGAKDDNVFWHYNLDKLKKKASPVFNTRLEKDAFDLKCFLENE